MADLVVELYGKHVGTLRGTWRSFDFLPEQEAVVEADLAEETLAVVLGQAKAEEPDPRAHPGLAGDIAGFTGKLRRGRAAEGG